MEQKEHEDGLPYLPTLASHLLQMEEVDDLDSCWNSDLQYVHLTVGKEPRHSLHNCLPSLNSSNGCRLKHLEHANNAAGVPVVVVVVLVVFEAIFNLAEKRVFFFLSHADD